MGLIHPHCKISTGIHEGLTFGKGELDDMGYWEFPCNECARENERLFPEDGKCWPFEGSTIQMSEKSTFVLQKTKKSFCPICDKEVYLLTPFEATNSKPSFYICFNCKFVGEVGVGAVMIGLHSNQNILRKAGKMMGFLKRFWEKHIIATYHGPPECFDCNKSDCENCYVNLK